MDTATQPSEKPAAPVATPEPVNHFGPLYNFVRTHVLIVNSLCAFATFLVGLLDFVFSRKPEIVQPIYGVIAVLGGVLLLAAIWPSFGAFITGHRFGEKGKRGAFQFGAALLLGVTAIGGASMATASQGGIIVSQFPGLQGLQSSLQGIEGKVQVLDNKLEKVDTSVQEVKQQVRQSTEEIKKTGNEIKEKLDVIASRPPVTAAAAHQSQNPRVLLQQMGVSWSTKSAIEALERCDGDTVELFARGKFDFFDASADTPIRYFAIHCKSSEKSRRVLKILSSNGVDLRQRFKWGLYSSDYWTSDIMSMALLHDNHNLVSALIDMGIKPESKYGGFMSLNETGNKFPLAVGVLRQATSRSIPADPQAIACEGEGMDTLKMLIKKNVLKKDAVAADLSKYCVFPPT